MLLEVSSEHADAEREIGLPGEVADFLRGFVVENLEVVFFEVGTSLLRRSRTVKRMSTRLTRVWMTVGFWPGGGASLPGSCGGRCRILRRAAAGAVAAARRFAVPAAKTCEYRESRNQD